MLRKAYSENHRFYHTGRHIEAMLEHFDANRGLATSPEDVELAIWFHDLIYKPFSTSNELDSADTAVSFLKKNGADEKKCGNVHRLIMATAHTALVEEPDQKLLVDIDLSILGASEKSYDQFERNVRKEYRWVPMPIYRRKRMQILSDFLSRESIYQTEYFRQRFESNARRNLLFTVDRLSR